MPKRIQRKRSVTESDWVHNDDPLDCGVRLPNASINLWRKPAVIAAWQSGGTLRDIARRYRVSHETVREWTRLHSKKCGASRRPQG